MCLTSNSWTGSTTTKKVTVTERYYDADGNMTKEVETVTETETTPNYQYQPPTPVYPYTIY